VTTVTTLHQKTVVGLRCVSSICSKGHGKHAECEPIMGGLLGSEPQQGPLPLVRQSLLKLKHFWVLDVQRKPQICPQSIDPSSTATNTAIAQGPFGVQGPWHSAMVPSLKDGSEGGP